MNRRAFVSMLAGLPVIGKYWKPKPRVLRTNQVLLTAEFEPRLIRTGTTVDVWEVGPAPMLRVTKEDLARVLDSFHRKAEGK